MLRFFRQRYSQLKDRLPARAQTVLGYLVDALILGAFWLVTSFWLNIRYPVIYPFEQNYRISIEVGVLLILLAVAQLFRLRLRWWVFALLSVCAVALRLFLTADNISNRFLYHDFRVPIDLHLVPEFFRLLYDTSPGPQLASYTALLVGFIIFSFLLSGFGSWLSYRTLARSRARHVLAAGILGLCVAGVVAAADGPMLYTRLVSKRVNKEIVAYGKLDAERNKIRGQIKGVSERIGVGDRLDKLQGNNVLFFFVESYGRTIWERPEHEQILDPVYKRVERNLKDAGFEIVSKFVTSPTFGGFSWFAHETINTGFKVVSHLHSRLLQEEKPTGLGHYFRDAGYRPIWVAPATTRPWPGMEDHWGFQSNYFSWQLGYKGPSFAWAPMADQYVIDYIHRKEVARSAQPLFIEYVLISTHAPWSDIPRYIDDWSKIGDGSIYHKIGRDKYNVSWSHLEDAAEAYSKSIEYDLHVLENYFTQFIHDDTLLIVLGDHQPNQAITGPDNLTWSVPMHIISRKRDFIEPFERRGFTPGMVPRQPLPHVGMERFLEEFLSDFSSEPLTVDPGVWGPPS
jgi:hypothetical protein